jgi:BspA type Leucine rich repeat region (6 copies)
VTLGTNVNTIGAQAFYQCASLASVNLPATVVNLGQSAFALYSNLQAILVEPGNPAFGSVEGVLFNHSQTTLELYPDGLAGAYTVPSGTTSIGDTAFSYCGGLTSVFLPSSVTSLGNYVFQACSNLTGIYIQGNAPSQGTQIFLGVNAAAKVCYFAGITGWSSAYYGGLPALKLGSPYLTLASAQSDGFSFTITGTNLQVLVIQATTNLAGANWQTLASNTLTAASFSFTDTQWMNFRMRFYRIKPVP